MSAFTVPLDTINNAIEELDQRLAQIGGCGDGNCLVVRPKGMHTNGGCRCLREDKYKAERVVYNYQRFAKAIRDAT